MRIRKVEKRDARAWELMRQKLWPSEPGEHAAEIAAHFDGHGDEVEVLIAETEEGEPAGFAELSIRLYAEGCYSGKVGYLEGWFVEERFRRQGVGAALVEAAIEWARGRECAEFASDTEIDNEVSAAAHRALGFEEVERIICFRYAMNAVE
ncbi:MAG: GNAT family N-acetyltransferase [Acidobacteriota bacterium]|nr:MAG: GNAT family N-acetyltransferase [Acidobacteriota bacterium]